MRFSGVWNVLGFLVVFGKSAGEHGCESGAGRLILERLVPDPDERGGSGFDAELVPESVEDEELVEGSLGRGVTACGRPCVGFGFDSGVGAGGGEAVGVNICAKSGPGSLGVGLGDSDGVKRRCAGR